MAFVITSSCSCGSVLANVQTEQSLRRCGKYDIDANSCIDCGMCRRMARLALSSRAN